MSEENRNGLANCPWNVWDIVKALALAVLWVVGSFIVAAIIVRVVPPDLRVSIERPLLVLVTALSEVSLLFAAWYFSVRKYHLSWASLGYTRWPAGSDLTVAVGTVVLFFVVISVYVAIVTALGLNWLLPEKTPPVFGEGLGGLMVGLVVAALVAPVVEETFFRGFVFGGLLERIGPPLAAVISAALFAVGHLQAPVILPIFVLGLLLAYLYRRSRSLWSCIFAHGLYNGTSLVLAYLVVSAGG